MRRSLRIATLNNQESGRLKLSSLSQPSRAAVIASDAASSARPVSLVWLQRKSPFAFEDYLGPAVNDCGQHTRNAGAFLPCRTSGYLLDADISGRKLYDHNSG
jgi:hypothetical protein